MTRARTRIVGKQVGTIAALVRDASALRTAND